MFAQGGTPPVDRILDTRLGKYYLSATSFADGKNVVLFLVDVLGKRPNKFHD